ncbi:MAG: hypothetical protein EP302_03365 [Bacteroidetes bacterium]|nr:MAG: hypothetical protein EP302_03365 [Bacteroidota bacterium]
MGKKKDKQLKKREKRLRNLAHALCPPTGCKPKCCKKYRKCESKRCSKCPCLDLLKELEERRQLPQVA